RLDMSALDNLRNIDRAIGCAQEIEGISRVLDELDNHGISGGYGTAPKPSFAAAATVPLEATTAGRTPRGADLLLFYATACPFSNYHPARMSVDGKDFHSSEQYFMWIKAKTFKDEETAAAILSADSPSEAKKLGRLVNDFNEDVWRVASIRIMTVACYRKFQQNPGLRKALLSTEGSVLVEAAPGDKIWGIGMAASKVDAKDPTKWKGTNNLGRILTVIREHMISSKVYENELKQL
ncbi:hypothetical protein PMAYCL1PPCAC_32502, partial [Pristionchus mayeri]